jgi:hypothetical protein
MTPRDHLTDGIIVGAVLLILITILLTVWGAFA